MEKSVREVRHVVSLKWPRNPFPGLRPFREEECVTFYGRNSQKDEVLARLNQSQLVFVTGPSGCGKSSLIKAGVLPALQAGLLTKAGYHWQTLQMRPGRRPLMSLAAAFESVAPRSDEAESGPGYDRIFPGEESGFWVAANAAAPLSSSSVSRAPARLLLLIDQFEEIFGEQIEDPQDVDRFVRLLVRFADRPHPNLFIIVTMRTDYLGQCAKFEGLAESINRTQFLTPVLTRDELWQAIARPAEDYNGTIEPPLVEQIIRDMRTGTAYISDSLPLMQHALLWMWSQAWRRAGGAEPPQPPFDDTSNHTKLTLEDYRANGGIQGILDRHAEDVLAEAAGNSEQRRKIAETLFRRLSERDSEGRYRRSPTSPDEICRIAGCTPGELQEVIRPFEHPDVCFLEQRQAESTGEPLIDISHESLIRQWNRAKGWADAEADKLRDFSELAHAAIGWERRNRSHNFLRLRGALEVLTTWWNEQAPNANWARRYTLHPEGGSLAEVFARVEEYVRVSSETDRAEQETAESERQARAAQKAQRQRNRYLFGALVVLLAAGVGLLWQRQENIRQAEENERQIQQRKDYQVQVTALMATQALPFVGAARSLLIAMEGIEDSLPERPDLQRAAYRALALLREQRILGYPGEGPQHRAQVQGVQFAPHATELLLTTSNDGNIRFWNIETGNLISAYSVEGRFLTARWSPDGGQLFVSTRDAEAFFLVPCSRAELQPYFPACSPAGGADKITKFPRILGPGVFSPDGQWLVTSGGATQTMSIWDVRDPHDLKEKNLGPAASFTLAAAFSHDSKHLAVGSANGDVRIFEVSTIWGPHSPEAKTLPQTNEPSADEPRAAPAPVTSLSFHKKNAHMLMATFLDGTSRLWRDISTKDRELVLRFDKGMIFQGILNPEEEWAAIAHEGGLIRLWPLASSPPRAIQLPGHASSILAITYAPGGDRFASASSDRTAIIWSQQSALAPKESASPPPAAYGGQVDVTRRGKQLLLKYQNRQIEFDVPNDAFEPAAAAVSPSGKDAIIAPKVGPPYLFNLASKEYIVALPGRPAKWAHIGFFKDPQGAGDGTPDRIVGLTEDGRAHSWPYFPSLRDLKQFAQQQIPFVGNEKRLSVKYDVVCRLRDKPEAECPSTQDISAQQ